MIKVPHIAVIGAGVIGASIACHLARHARVTGVFVAVMHSGVTLAAIIGRLLAPEVLGRGESLLLQAFRPGRFE